jgi:beta-glucosidase
VGGFSYDPTPGVSVLDGIRKRVGRSIKVSYAEGSRIHEAFQGWQAWWDDAVVAPPDKDEEARVAAAVETARSADSALLVVGENEAVCREGWSEKHLGDRDSLDLPGHQAELIDAVVATGTPTVVLLINGRALSIPDVAEKVPAILEGFYLGEGTGTAVLPGAGISSTPPRLSSRSAMA